MMTIADLFDPEPEQWGLRGDPYLWREMKASFTKAPLPQSGADFRDILLREFHELAGVPLSEIAEMHYVERYAHGGMSSGHISSDFWTKRALAMLGLRFANALGRQRLTDDDWPQSGGNK